MKKNITLTLLTLLLLTTGNLFAQAVPKGVDKQSVKQDALLTSKQWMCIDVKRKKLTKMDFKFEVGNEMSLSIDKKYSFKNNRSEYPRDG